MTDPTDSTNPLKNKRVTETTTRHGGDPTGELEETTLFTPLTIRGVLFRNRIAVSPMCQYSASDGMADDWHLVHLGSRAVGGAGLILVEATAVTAQGRISPGDLGIWEDRQIKPLARIASFLKRMGAAAGIQLAHAGRKASSIAPFLGGGPLHSRDDGAWEIIAPSPIPFGEHYQTPKALDKEAIQQVIEAFAAAAQRAVRAGFGVIEIHAAHGYLLHQFLSPLSNQRDDEYGGTLENRLRLPVEVAARVRQAIPADMPLFVRISATDWVEGGWDLEQSVALARSLRRAGVDLIDVSSGGTKLGVTIPVGPGYQVPFASVVRKEAGIMTGAVGLITEPEQANAIIVACDADIVLLGREMLREPYWALKAEHALGAEETWPVQYGYAVRRRR